jgi:hypothetical protein
MDIPTEFLIAGIAGAAVLLLFLGIAAKPAPDAVQQRLSQLVAQPKSLEEMELEEPFFERTFRPMVKRLAGIRKSRQGGMVAKAQARLARAGNPGGLQGADWMGVKLLVAIGAALGGFAIGLLLGGFAGAFGGRVDNVLMRVTDLMLSIPGLLTAITISVILGQSLTSVMIAIAIVNIPIFARLLRGSMLAQRESDYVLAAR